MPAASLVSPCYRHGTPRPARSIVAFLLLCMPSEASGDPVKLQATHTAPPQQLGCFLRTEPPRSAVSVVHI